MKEVPNDHLRNIRQNRSQDAQDEVKVLDGANAKEQVFDARAAKERSSEDGEEESGVGTSKQSKT